jgi:hypothetical protein
MLNKLKRNNTRFTLCERAYNYLLVLRKKVDISKCKSLARRKTLLVVGKVFIFLLVEKMARVHNNKMKEVRFA